MNTQTIPKKTRDFFKDRLRRGDKVFFSNIGVRDINGQVQKLGGIQIKAR